MFDLGYVSRNSARYDIPKERNRPPLRTLKKMAEEFGISRQSLTAYLRHDDNAPSFKMKSGNKNAHNTWYEPNEMRKWWKNRNIINGESK